MQRQGDIAPPPPPSRQERVLLEKAVAGLSEGQRAEFEANIWLLHGMEDLRGRCGFNVVQAYTWFKHLYNDGSIEAPPWVREAYGTVSEGSLKRWRETLLREGAAGLAHKWGAHRKGTGIIDSNPALQDLIVGLLASKPHVDAAQAHQLICARMPEVSVAERSVRRWIARWKDEHGAVFEAVSNPDAFRSHKGVAFGKADESVIALNQCWEMDSTPGDVMCTDGRHNLVGVIDVWSRRARFLVTPTSKGLHVTTLLRQGIQVWGVPAAMKHDGGRDYTGRHVRRALVDLGIRSIACPPYSPERKPHIERVLGTLSHQFLELLPGYIGHDVAGRKAIENRRGFAQRREEGPLCEVALTAAELQAKVDDWADYVYGRAPHRNLDGTSPFEKACEWTGPVKFIEDERALDVLLAEAPGQGGFRKVTKTGIRLDGATFIAAEMGAYVGVSVHVKYDAADLGAIYVFEAATGAFVCKAMCPERTGIDRAEAAAMAKAIQARFIATEKAKLRRAVAAIKPETVAEDILNAGRRAATVVVPCRARARPTGPTP